jgi:hypothetical protein
MGNTFELHIGYSAQPAYIDNTLHPFFKILAPAGIRTPDLLIRSQSL